MRKKMKSLLLASICLSLFAGHSALAKDNAENKLDIVLKCESDDGEFSKIVNLKNDSFTKWNANNSQFEGSRCNEEYDADKHPERKELYRWLCEITPLAYKYEARLYMSGHGDPPEDRLGKFFHVDRTTGRFTYREFEGFTDKKLFDVTGTCSVTERPKPPATKF